MAAASFDYVILDTPAALSDIVAVALQLATEVLLVSGTDASSIKGAAYVLTLLEAQGRPDDQVRVIVNHLSDDLGFSLEEVESVLLQDVFWEIPYDEQVPRAARRGRPVVLARSKSTAAQYLTDLACQFLSEVQ